MEKTAGASRPFLLTSTPEMMAREGLVSDMLPREDGLRQDTGKGKFEWWYFDAQLDDGSKIVVVVLTKPIIASGGPLAPKVEITLTKANGEIISDWSYPEPGEFSASREACEVRAGATKVSGDLETYSLEVSGKILKADLTFKRIVPSWRAGAGKVYFDAELSSYMGWVVPLPRASVTGTITGPEGEKAVKGEGYHDHNWGNYPIENVFDYWFWGRARIGAYTVLFFDGVGSKRWGAAHLPLFMLAKDEAIIVREASDYSVLPSEMVEDGAKHGRAYPRRLLVSQSGEGVKATFSFSDPRITERDDMLSSAAPKFLVPLLRPLMNPWYYRFEASLDASIELAGAGAEDRIHGAGLYEMMLFGKASGLA